MLLSLKTNALEPSLRRVDGGINTTFYAPLRAQLRAGTDGSHGEVGKGRICMRKEGGNRADMTRERRWRGHFSIRREEGTQCATENLALCGHTAGCGPIGLQISDECKEEGCGCKSGCRSGAAIGPCAWRVERGVGECVQSSRGSRQGGGVSANGGVSAAQVACEKNEAGRITGRDANNFDAFVEHNKTETRRATVSRVCEKSPPMLNFCIAFQCHPP